MGAGRSGDRADSQRMQEAVVDVRDGGLQPGGPAAAGVGMNAKGAEKLEEGSPDDERGDFVGIGQLPQQRAGRVRGEGIGEMDRPVERDGVGDLAMIPIQFDEQTPGSAPRSDSNDADPPV